MQGGLQFFQQAPSLPELVCLCVCVCVYLCVCIWGLHACVSFVCMCGICMCVYFKGMFDSSSLSLCDLCMMCVGDMHMFVLYVVLLVFMCWSVVALCATIARVLVR